METRMKRLDMLLALILIILVAVLALALVNRNQAPPAAVNNNAAAAQVLTLPTQLADAEAQVNQLNAEQPFMTPVPDSLSETFVNWESFQATYASLAMPSEYELGTLTTEYVRENADQLGMDAETIALVEMLPNNFALYAYDAETEGEVRPSVYVFQVPIGPGLEQFSIADFMDMGIQSLPPSMRLIHNRIVPLNGREAIRLVAENTAYDTPLMQMSYTFFAENTIWDITYTSDVESFDALLPMFETSARTLAVQPVPTPTPPAAS
jgi:hypothetical protein